MEPRVAGKQEFDEDSGALYGPRVLLRAPEPSDESEFVALRLASREFLAPWEATSSSHDPFGPERFRRFVLRSSDRRRFLLHRRDDGRLAGALSLSRIDRVRRCAAIGFWIGAQHARQGLMGEALSLLLAWSESGLGLERVDAYALPENAASIALLRKCGFSFEATAPDHRVVAGRSRDHELWTCELRRLRSSSAGSPERYLPQSRK